MRICFFPIVSISSLTRAEKQQVLGPGTDMYSYRITLETVVSSTLLSQE